MSFVKDHSKPMVSVGILTRNGGNVFAQAMDALLKQETPWPFEIVVLDSASRDRTDRLAAERGARVVPYRPAKFRFGPARDYLFEQTQGQVIVTISQDVVPASKDWLEKMVAPILNGCADATVGEQTVAPGGYAFYWDYHASWLRSVAVNFDQAHGRVAISCSNLAIRRSVWEEHRFGDCEAIEDRVLQVKLHKAGKRMMQVKNAISFHGHDYTWKDLCNRTGSFAFGWARLGWPYTLGRLARDLAQPSRYRILGEAFIGRRLRSWKEFWYPIAMCFIQYSGSRKRQWS